MPGQGGILVIRNSRIRVTLETSLSRSITLQSLYITTIKYRPANSLCKVLTVSCWSCGALFLWWPGTQRDSLKSARSCRSSRTRGCDYPRASRGPSLPRFYTPPTSSPECRTRLVPRRDCCLKWGLQKNGDRRYKVSRRVTVDAICTKKDEIRKPTNDRNKLDQMIIDNYVGLDSRYILCRQKRSAWKMIS